MFKKEPSLRIRNSKKVISFKIIRFFGIALCCFGIVFGVYYLIRWQVEREISTEQIISVQESAKIEEVEDTEETEIIESEEPESNPYWDFIKLSMLDVDFEKLKAMNSNTVGWIKVNGTNINYPFVQASDNKYYLKHTFNHSYNSAGWVFLDYRNNNKLTKNKNSIIYAHGRFDGSMFGTLKNTLSSSWQGNINNYVIQISTPEENSMWQIFSAYRVPTTSDYLEVDFSNNEFNNFIERLKSRSVYDFRTVVNQSDKILTLSTCIGSSSERMVVHAKLIKVTPKV